MDRIGTREWWSDRIMCYCGQVVSKRACIYGHYNSKLHKSIIEEIEKKGGFVPQIPKHRSDVKMPYGFELPSKHNPRMKYLHEN